MVSYSYATVETALAAVFGADLAAQKGALRGRIQHLRRLGLPSENPGRGKVIAYNDAQVCAWLLALQCEEFGLDPSLIVKMIKQSWDYLRKLIKLSRKTSDDDVLVMLAANFMSGAWTQPRGIDPTYFTYCRASATEALLDAIREEGQQFCVFNFSARLRTFDAALRSIQEKQNEALDGS